MGYIPALNSKGRFSVSKVKQELKKLEPEKTKPRKISFGWLILAIVFVSLIMLFWAKNNAHAAVFDNTSSTIPGICQIHKDASANRRWYVGTFSSSTQIINIQDLTFPVCVVGGGAAATSTIRLDIASELGAWYSVSSVFAPTCTVGGASSTHIFGYGTAVWNVASGTAAWPIYGPGGSFEWELTSDDVFTDGLAPGIAQSTWNPPQFGTAADNICYQAPPSSTTTGFYPQIKINGVSIYQAPAPNPADYGLTATTSAANQDFGFFGNMLRDILIWLFTPSETIRINYENEKNRLLTQKIPFAYFGAASSTLGSVSTTTDGAELIAGVTTTMGYFELINTANIRANSLMTVLDIIKFWFRVALWAAFLFYVYHTIRDFKP